MLLFEYKREDITFSFHIHRFVFIIHALTVREILKDRKNVYIIINFFMGGGWGVGVVNMHIMIFLLTCYMFHFVEGALKNYSSRKDTSKQITVTTFLFLVYLPLLRLMIPLFIQDNKCQRTQNTKHPLTKNTLGYI